MSTKSKTTLHQPLQCATHLHIPITWLGGHYILTFSSRSFRNGDDTSMSVTPHHCLSKASYKLYNKVKDMNVHDERRNYCW